MYKPWTIVNGFEKMRIGELAKRADISRDSIRFYERHGLLTSDVDPQAGNNYRSYPEDAVFTLEVIRDAQAAGLSIADITVFMSQLATQGQTSGDATEFLDAKIQEVSERISGGTRFLKLLQQTKTALQRAPQDGLNEMSGEFGKPES